MKSILIVNATIINENSRKIGDIFIKNGRIEQIADKLSHIQADTIIDATNKYVIPGMIDDQVHFREPGLTDKADIRSESLAGVIGGTTTYMDMPNNKPPIITNEGLDKKFQVAEDRSFANYSFYLGATNDNIEEIKNTSKRACGVKVFMGASTGNMLVDNLNSLEEIFIHCPKLIATHCESSPIIDKNLKAAKEKYGDDIPLEMHTEIRSRECCIESSTLAVNLARNFGSRLHVLHLTTKDEIDFFSNAANVAGKSITAEVCIHHLWFSDQDYQEKGTHIKWNPAVKTAKDRDGLWEALLDDRIDVLATDHAPHTLEEKNNVYTKAPSGGPLVQHAVTAILEKVKEGVISIEKAVEKMSHNPAKLFQIEKRGFIKEGYYADLVLIDTNKPQTVSKENLLYKCGWSPFEGTTFSSTITHTFVNGVLMYNQGVFNENTKGKRITFNR